MTRTFIAVEMGSRARDALAATNRDLAEALPDVRFVDPASMHLTLAFLGELDDERLKLAHEATAIAAREHEPFELAVDGLGVFGPRRAPRVIWAGVSGATDRLLAVQRRLTDELIARGFPPEERAYSPHLTLARLKRPLTGDELTRLERFVHTPVVDPAPIPVTSLDVMKSELTRTGALYTYLRRYSLASR